MQVSWAATSLLTGEPSCRRPTQLPKHGTGRGKQTWSPSDMGNLMWGFLGAEGSGPGFLGPVGLRGLSGPGEVNSPLLSGQQGHAAESEVKLEGGLRRRVTVAGVCLCEGCHPPPPSPSLPPPHFPLSESVSRQLLWPPRKASHVASVLLLVPPGLGSLRGWWAKSLRQARCLVRSGAVGPLSKKGC